jgi:hypothetical protein
MSRFAVFHVPAAEVGTVGEMRFTEGSAAECVAVLLGELTLPELNRLKLDLIGAEQRRRVGRRVAAETARTGVARPAPVEEAETFPLVSEADEDGDEVMEATPLEVFAPDCGPRQQ